MPQKISWSAIDPELHGFQYLTREDKILYHIEYCPSLGITNTNNSLVYNYKKDISFKNEKSWYYKTQAINHFANIICRLPFSDIDNRLLLSAPTSKCRNSELFDSRNDDVITLVHRKIGIPISFNLDAIEDSSPTHSQSGYRNPSYFKDLFSFIPFVNEPKIVYIVDDVITSGSHFVVWRDLIKNAHPSVKVRGLYLARTVNTTKEF